MSPEEKRAFDFHRFMRMVEVGKGKKDCWTWTGNKPDGRYGHFSMGYGKTLKAHRWLYELVVGPIPEGLLVRHKCDNPQCVNPRHLLVGTHADNARDKIERGRNADRKGEKHPLAKLTAEKVLEIRKLSAMGATQKELASVFGVRHGQIGKVVRRDNWSHI